MTDAEQVECCREQMQSLLDRADYEAGDTRAVLDSTGLHHEAKRVFAPDMTELGRFEVVLPPGMVARMSQLRADALRPHWVYRHKDGTLYVLGLPARLMLRRAGYARLYAFVQENN